MTSANADFMNAENVRKFTPGDSWPEPNMSVVNAGMHEPPELPIEHFSMNGDGETLSGAAACILEEARRKSCPPDYVAGSIMAVAAALIGNSRLVKAWGNYHEPVALNVGLVGSPSAMKSPAMDIALGPLKDFERDLETQHNETLRAYERDLFSAEAARDAWKEDVKTASKEGVPAPDMPERAEIPNKPGCPCITVTDATVPAMAENCSASRKGVLLNRDELAGWLQNLGVYGGDGDRSFYIESYGGRSYSIDRKKNGRRISIERLLISILGGIQPDKLHTALLKGDDDGLAARFLYFWPNPAPFVRPPDDCSDTGLRRALARLNALDLQDVGDDRREPLLLSLTETALNLFAKWCEEISSRGNDVEGLMAGFLGKARGGVLRIAAILAHLDWAFGDEQSPPSHVSANTVQRAILLYDEYFIAMAQRAFGDAARPADERQAAILAKAIIKRKPEILDDDGFVYVRDVQRLWKPAGLDRVNKIVSAFSVLSEMDWSEDVSDRAGANKGRKARIYRINPRIWQQTP